ncbi:hypothetical protein [Peptoniphilus sp. oral taxon 386]|uniref:hypothetical protein n=1 Tax=Peptoniphilus sp. oral taxon 386 TaxID=652713 RepID=UPI00031185EA|nr:hypothetical protein [Peptoniphilus sp. oral taxon 386]
MKKQSKILYAFTILSIILLIIISCFCGYSYLNVKNIHKIEEENTSLNNKLVELLKVEEQLKTESNSENLNLEKLSLDFSSKYGYDYTQKEENIIKLEIENLKAANVLIKKQLKDEIKKYSKYYSGDYYKNESLDAIISKLVNLNNMNGAEYLNTNLYTELKISNFIRNAKLSGTIKYLSSINNDNSEINLLLFTTALYSKDLNEIGNDLSDIDENLNKIYAQIISTEEIFSNLEKYGVNTGNLSSKNLSLLKNNCGDLIRQYYENKGVIEILTNIGDKNEKSK